ncbi:50S ribosomal protein L3-2, chloroplastic [Smittium culicis]|uniref:Large ribosomal subunit protein uL3m n=1 Tax=Smittium culicis TaxID=133412 RepID=A0A1R1XDC1_9FUNG|nr:50S ribosomal protein L3-2, chloroplastic [Smittium culicis]
MLSLSKLLISKQSFAKIALAVSPKTIQISTFATLNKEKATLDEAKSEESTPIVKRKGKIVPTIKPGVWTPESKRVGVIAKKVGMTFMWDEWGIRTPVTILHLEGVQVVSVVKTSNDNYPRLQIGAGYPKTGQINKPLSFHFKKHQVAARTTLSEFPVTPDAVLPPGTKINVSHFVPGQLVDVTGVSKGKGFAGVMKKWGFAGGRASHGASLSHRTAGSTGQNQDPGRVFPGKKMAGKMGNDNITVMELKVMKIDTALNVLYVKGSVPGNKGGIVKVRDAIKKNKVPKFPAGVSVPFPTYVLVDGEPALPREMIARVSEKDPLLLKQ